MAAPIGGRKPGRSNIGRLRNLLTIQVAAADADEFGQHMPQVWTDVATVPAAIEPVTGREDQISGNVQVLATHLITMRYRADVNEKNRLVWKDGNNLVLNILAVLPSVGSRNSLLIYAKKGLS